MAIYCTNRTSFCDIDVLLLPLYLIIATIEPVEQAKTLGEFFAMLSGDRIVEIAIAATLTWAAYSRIAAVLLTSTLAAEHIVIPTAALALVLGTHLRYRPTALSPLQLLVSELRRRRLLWDVISVRVCRRTAPRTHIKR